MSLSDWYLVLFCAGAGLSIVAFWLFIVATGRLSSLIEDPGVARAHAIAEIVTGALLIAGAITLVIDDESRLSFSVVAMGLGALIYALISSPSLYPGNKTMRLAFSTGWLFAAPAVVVLVASA